MWTSIPRVLLLLVALLYTQWAGLAHVVSHHDHDPHHPHEPAAACELCGAYGMFDHGLPSLPPVGVQPDSVESVVLLPHVPEPVELPLRSRSRGPPPVV